MAKGKFLFVLSILLISVVLGSGCCNENEPRATAMANDAKADSFGTLVEFYGEGCKYCAYMEPFIAQLRAEGIQIDQVEVWHNKRNWGTMQRYDKGCRGVPFFVNTKNGDSLCGAVPFEALKAWADRANVH